MDGSLNVINVINSDSLITSNLNVRDGIILRGTIDIDSVGNVLIDGLLDIDNIIANRITSSNTSLYGDIHADVVGDVYLEGTMNVHDLNVSNINIINKLSLSLELDNLIVKDNFQVANLSFTGELRTDNYVIIFENGSRRDGELTNSELSDVREINMMKSLIVIIQSIIVMMILYY